LECEGFKHARLYIDENNHKHDVDVISIHFYNESKEKLEHYFHHQSEQFRQEGRKLWGDDLKAYRRILRWEYFEKKNEQK
jgi:hypothetical protein